MTDFELMESRHSVRSYLDKPIEDDKKELIKKAVATINKESNLHIQVFFDEPKCFDVIEPGYGKFKNCKNYFVMVGNKGDEEKTGYYGEKLVLYAQELGLNTCWAGASYKRGNLSFDINKGEKLHLVIGLGYGETQGHSRKTKSIGELSNADSNSPEWFINGMKAVQLAPTAINQQRFHFTRNGNKVKAKCGLFIFTKVDLGIAKYHFELGAGKENFEWD